MESYLEMEQRLNAANRELENSRRRWGSNIGRRYANASLEECTSKALTDYALNISDNVEKGNGLYIFGDKGVGKTYLAAAIANTALEQEKSVKFTSAAEILLAVKASFSSKQSEKGSMQEYLTTNVLFLDDFGVEKFMKDNEDTWSQERIIYLVNYRYNNLLPIIFTSNYSLADLASKRGVSGRIIDRIRETCDVVKIEGKSWRDKS